MKVEIGPYKNFFGCHQLAYLFKYVGFNETNVEKLSDILCDIEPLNKLFLFIDTKRKRKIIVRTRCYDIWSIDTTLSNIILPLLKRYKSNKISAAIVEDCDVPDHLLSVADDKIFEKWDYVLDEMIFAFEHLIDDSWEEQFHVIGFDREGYMKFDERIQKGLFLFGKYFRNLWD